MAPMVLGEGVDFVPMQGRERDHLLMMSGVGFPEFTGEILDVVFAHEPRAWFRTNARRTPAFSSCRAAALCAWAS